MSWSSVTVLGVPSSAGAFAAGQEDAPAALRDAGLLRRLAAAGVAVADAGDTPRFRWRPDAANRRAQNLDAVVATVAHVRAATAESLARSQPVLVVGGDCTVGIGTVAGALDADGELGLVYLDMHADLNVPSSVPDGALDWMGLAHMLGVEGCAAPLRDVGPRRPLLDSSHVVVLGHEPSQATVFERRLIDEAAIRCVSAEQLRRDPAAAAGIALEALPVSCGCLVVHFDVDVVDFTDAPLSENTGRNIGVALADAFCALARLGTDQRVVALTVTELNPTHAAVAPGLLATVCDGLCAAVAPRDAGRGART
jgi:arginase